MRNGSEAYEAICDYRQRRRRCRLYRGHPQRRPGRGRHRGVRRAASRLLPAADFLLFRGKDRHGAHAATPAFTSRTAVGCCTAGRRSVWTRRQRRWNWTTAQSCPYDSLCVAAGSSPFLPPLEGLRRSKKTFTFMTLDDALALEAAVKDDSRVLIVGAGLIGLKCAEGLYNRAASITVCDLPAGAVQRAGRRMRRADAASGIWRRTASASCLATACAVWTAKRRI